MWTYSTINLVITLTILGVGILGFLGGWLAHRSVVRERNKHVGAQIDDETQTHGYGA
ncbi:MAG: hypothetical protein MRY63_08620 [Neomegalonema sp.]|nr:hypothetical protein [Neomegalonema sp.]